MNRREFFKGLLGVGAVAVLPKFKPPAEKQGRWIDCGDNVYVERATGFIGERDATGTVEVIGLPEADRQAIQANLSTVDHPLRVIHTGPPWNDLRPTDLAFPGIEMFITPEPLWPPRPLGR